MLLLGTWQRWKDSIMEKSWLSQCIISTVQAFRCHGCEYFSYIHFKGFTLDTFGLVTWTTSQAMLSFILTFLFVSRLGNWFDCWSCLSFKHSLCFIQQRRDHEKGEYPVLFFLFGLFKWTDFFTSKTCFRSFILNVYETWSLDKTIVPVTRHHAHHFKLSTYN